MDKQADKQIEYLIHNILIESKKKMQDRKEASGSDCGCAADREEWQPSILTPYSPYSHPYSHLASDEQDAD